MSLGEGIGVGFRGVSGRQFSWKREGGGEGGGVV